MENTNQILLAQKVAFSTIYQSIGKVLAVFLGLAQVYLLTRHLGAIGFGQYNTVTAFLGFALVFSDLGLYMITVREISKPGANQSRILSNAFTIRLVSSVIVVGLAALLGWFFFPYEQEIKLGIILTAFGFTLLSVNQVFVGVFQKYFANHMLVLGEIVAKSIMVLAIIILMNLGLGVVPILVSLNLAFMVHLGLTLYFAYQYIPFKLSFDWPFWLKILKESWPIGFSVVLSLIYFKADTIILSIYQSSVDVGIYSVPYKILEVLISFPGMFVGLLVPLLSAVAFKNSKHFQKIMQKGFDFLIMVAFLVILQVWLFADQIVLFVAGPGFEASASIFKILIIAIGFLFIGSLFGHAIPTLNLQKQMVYGYALAAILGLITYFTLIPRISYYGAAYGTLLTELTVAVYAFVLIYKKTGLGLSLKSFQKSLLAVSVTAVLAYISLNFLDVSWVLMMVFLTLIYILNLYLTGAFKKEEFSILVPERFKFKP